VFDTGDKEYAQCWCAARNRFGKHWSGEPSDVPANDHWFKGMGQFIIRRGRLMLDTPDVPPPHKPARPEGLAFYNTFGFDCPAKS